MELKSWVAHQVKYFLQKSIQHTHNFHFTDCLTQGEKSECHAYTLDPYEDLVV